MSTRRLLGPLALLFAPFTVGSAAEPVDFNRDVRPILSDTCFVCHGPDATDRPTELRLDLRDSATAKLESGGVAIMPGHPDASEFVRRITTLDASEKMPPADYRKHLTPAQIETLTRWVAEGAVYEGHWAFETPTRPVVPEVGPVGNPIDGFVNRKLDDAGLKPNPPADPTRQLRRVTFDLTGLPPTLAELDAYQAACEAVGAEVAYRQAVDRLLASPRYGEHQARFWLDAARYGDTHGLHLDNLRSMYPYRTWVIDAFNANEPFDRFTVEQIAGDLLPTPTTQQRVATGFNRCNVSTSEGGAINEEFRVRYAVDRTEAIGTVFLGLTVGCAVCHDHKFDPVSQKEFYRLFAYYNSTADPAMDGNIATTPPVMSVPTADQTERKTELAAATAKNEADFKTFVASLDYGPPLESEPAVPVPTDFVWIDDDLPAGATPSAQGDDIPGWRWISAGEGPVLSGSRASVRTANKEGVAQHFFTGATEPITVQAGDVLFAYCNIDPANPPESVMLQWNDGAWEHRAFWGSDKIPFGATGTPAKLRRGDLPPADVWTRLEVPAADVGLKPGAKLNGLAFTQYGGTVRWDRAGVTSIAAEFVAARAALGVWEPYADAVKDKLPEPVRTALAVAKDKRTPEQVEAVEQYFVAAVHPKTKEKQAAFVAERDRLAAASKALEEAIPETLVMADSDKLREAFILLRGEYDQHGEKVEPGVPAFLPQPAADASPNRLTLANWLVRPDHPLTARVTVNRIWQRYFGVGLVKSAEDFGSQGEWPSHPGLIDWLAVEFIGSGWDVKHVHRLIVTSDAYRRSSTATPDLLAADPEDRLLARGPRVRLDGEEIRDAALSAAGLLVETLGGASVKPYQPEGVWEAVAFRSSNTLNYVQDKGPGLYRRGLYTFWKRTSPPPMLQTFDAPSREACVVRRSRTNTPLQALALMNDVQFVEASRALAARMLREGGPTAAERLAYGFRLVTARTPSPTEAAILSRTYESQLAHYKSDAAAAEKLLAVGESPRDATLDAAEHAATTLAANLILNLDEAITKE